MEYMGNMEYWDKKFAERGSSPLSPEKSLVQNIGLFKKGTVLDLASGDGRNALFLSAQGFHVTAVDFSEEALCRLTQFAAQAKADITTMQMDLSLPNVLNSLGVYDNIVINHYRLDKTQLFELSRHLSRDGVLFACGFGHKHTPNQKIRQEDLIQPEDFEEIKAVLQKIQYEEEQDERGFFVTYLFRNTAE